MSGPKYSTAYIRELRRLQQLEKQLKEQLENSKRKQVLADIARLEKEKDRCFDDLIISDCKDIVKEAEELVPDSRNLAEIRKILAQIDSFKRESCGITGNSEDLLKRYNAYQGKLQAIRNAMLMLKDLKKQLSLEGTQALQEKKLDEFMNIHWEDTGEKIDIIPSDLQEIYLEVLELLSQTDNYEESKVVIDETIMRTGDTDYKRRQLELRKKAIIVEQNASNDVIRLLSLTNELRALHSLLGWDAKEIPKDEDGIEEAIDIAEEALKKKQASDYIAACIHKVFEEKGYDLVDDAIVSTTNGDVQKGLYEFGDDSLLNVSMSSAGQLLFEVVGDGDAKSMDSTRAAQLESEMRRFCPNYAEIKDILLKEYGISLENEHLCEPDQKYAKAIDTKSSKSERRAKKEKKMKHYDD